MKNLITIALLCLLTSAYSQEEISGNNIDTQLGIGKWSDCLEEVVFALLVKMKEVKQILN
ncbi:hypothetical protein [Nonlabens sp.]|uniref:hypothetical protein n=1 Tax=Nonlabens sp. TaxID=1888209 RepID=UPI003F69FDFE